MKDFGTKVGLHGPGDLQEGHGGGGWVATLVAGLEVLDVLSDLEIALETLSE